MTVAEAIDTLNREAYEDEKEHELHLVDQDGNVYRILKYDWGSMTFRIYKV
jgi:Mg/Co/Ni transporter MgtE